MKPNPFAPRRLFLVAAVVALVALNPVVYASGPVLTGPISVADWAERVWRSAGSGRSDEVFALLDALPDKHEIPAVEELRAGLDRRRAHLAEADAQRAQRLEEVWAELDEKTEADDLSDALRTAVEIYSLSSDGAEVLRNEKIAALVGRGEAAALRAEQAGNWLEAQELYFRLNLLYEDSARFEEPLKRTSTRLMMIRLYAPERLHEIRNADRIKEGLEPLPPFNRMGEDWRDKLAGIDDPNVLVRALNTAQLAHVDGASLSDMLLGGIDQVRTMITTPDLASAFPSLREARRVESFGKELEALAESVRQRGDRADAYDLTRTIRKLLDANRSGVNIPVAAIMHEFGNGAMNRLDQFSAIIWPDELKQFQKTTQGRFTGVGIQIQLDEAQRLKVVTPIEGTPAHRAGILPGDIITQVDDEPTIGITLNGAVDRITGERGTRVTLTVQREGAAEPLKFPLVRDVIPIYSVKGWRRSGPHETDWDWFIDPEQKIGYVRITQFADGVTREFDRAYREMRQQGVNGLIVDFRFNPGGLLNEAVDLANRFVSDGVIVSQHDAAGVAHEVKRARRSNVTVRDIPVVVLINEGAASASEIVAGALQDHKLAVLVGERTFGKGSVQQVYDVGRGLAALRLTIQYYRLPNGRLIHRRPGMKEWGIAPDVHAGMSPARMGESLRLRQDADIIPLDAVGRAGEAPDPSRLITEGIDLQLETALLLVQSQAIAAEHGVAVINPVAPAAGVETARRGG